MNLSTSRLDWNPKCRMVLNFADWSRIEMVNCPEDWIRFEVSVEWLSAMTILRGFSVTCMTVLMTQAAVWFELFEVATM